MKPFLFAHSDASPRGSSVLALVLCAFASASACSKVEAPTRSAAAESASVKRIRQVFARVPETLAKNHKTFVVPDGTVTGFGAGDAYPQIWLRDSAWIVPAAAAYYDGATLTSWLDLHLAAAQKNGRLRDWVAPGTPDVFREWAPRVAALGALSVDTNSNESDQEPSAALAWCRAREALSTSATADPADAGRVRRLIQAMDALLRDRTDRATGLVWSGLTADWGDVSPLYPDQRAIYLDEKTPRTLSLYTNVMATAALECLAPLALEPGDKQRLARRAAQLRASIDAHFWMKERGFFRIRKSLDPLPSEAFGRGEDDRFALGGNALAALLGIANEAQAASMFETAERLRVLNNFSTISTTLIPPYEEGVFQHPAMREPFQYQNGGQWDWFGALLVQAEFERGHSVRARAHLDQIVARILRAGPGIHEWYAQDGSPKGSGAYAATAAVLHNAIVRGLLGVSSSDEGYRVAIRTGETLLPMEVPQRAAGTRLVVSQAVSSSAIDVLVSGTARVAEVCSLLPRGRAPADPSRVDAGPPRRVLEIGSDTLLCADVSASTPPFRVSFRLRPLAASDGHRADDVSSK